MDFDLAVIGGGPGGYTAAAQAAQAGLSVVLYEKDELGGTCLNRGCIPTKALLRTAGTLNALRSAATLGVNAGPISCDFAAMQARKTQVVETLRSGVEKLMKSSKVTVLRGEAQITAAHTVTCNNETHTADNIIVAVGAAPAAPPIPGLDGPLVYTSDDLLSGAGQQFSSLIIIGGGVIGVEFATIYQALGSTVTIIEAADRILPLLDKELGQRLNMYLRKRGVTVCDKASVSKITAEGDSVSVTFTDKAGKEQTVSAAGVLAAMGRKPALGRLFAAGAEPELLRGAIVGDGAGRTSLPWLYVIGDAKAGNIQLAHVATADAENAVAAILGQDAPVDMSVIPSCIFTEPEIASVGLSEEEAKAAGHTVRTAKYLTGANGKCLIEEAESGFVKLVCDAESRVILGAQLVCPHAADLIGELTLAVQQKLTADQLAAVIHPHPTFCEMILGAASAI